MATYRQIHDWVRQRHGCVPKSCWIAHVKQMCGLPARRSPNRRGVEGPVPCLEDVATIREAFQYFGMVE
jgi:hypothetical protein